MIKLQTAMRDSLTVATTNYSKWTSISLVLALWTHLRCKITFLCSAKLFSPKWKRESTQMHQSINNLRQNLEIYKFSQRFALFCLRHFFSLIFHNGAKLKISPTLQEGSEHFSVFITTRGEELEIVLCSQDSFHIVFRANKPAKIEKNMF